MLAKNLKRMQDSGFDIEIFNVNEKVQYRAKKYGATVVSTVTDESIPADMEFVEKCDAECLAEDQATYDEQEALGALKSNEWNIRMNIVKSMVDSARTELENRVDPDPVLNNLANALGLFLEGE